MRKLTVFNDVTLDGYFVGASGDDDAEYSEFVAENAKRGGRLMFGRITYELMASMQEKLTLSLMGTRTFKNGKVLLSYKPAG